MNSMSNFLFIVGRSKWLCVAASGLFVTVVARQASAQPADSSCKFDVPTAISPGPLLSTMRDGCWDDFHLNVMRAPLMVTIPIFRGEDVTYEKASLVKEENWGPAWGFTDTPQGVRDNVMPYCILAEGVSVLERAGAEATSDRFVLKEAWAYVQRHVETLVPHCDEEDSPSARAGSTDPIATAFAPKSAHTKLFSKFFGRHAAMRASLLLHEAWHRGASVSHPGDGKSDKEYHNIYAHEDTLFDYTRDRLEGRDPIYIGAYSMSVAWLEDYIHLPNSPKGGRVAITDASRTAALASANNYLRSRFVTPTPKRINMFDEAMVINAPTTTAFAKADTEYGVYHYRGVPESDSKQLMGASAEEACGLTGLAGSFRGEDDYVRIVWEEVTVGGVTAPVRYLKARSDQNRERRQSGGNARCFPGKRLIFEGEYLVDGNTHNLRQPITIPGTLSHEARNLDALNDTCFLTGVEGRLEGERDAMGVRVNADNEWEVYITTNTEIDSRNYFKLGVACIQTPPAYFLDNEATYTGPDENGNPSFVHPNRKSPSVLFSTVSYPDSGFSHACALSEVTGRMYNVDDRVLIHENDVKNQKDRNDVCQGIFLGQGPFCTNWNFRVGGDGHLLDRDLNPRAVCFEY